MKKYPANWLIDSTLENFTRTAPKSYMLIIFLIIWLIFRSVKCQKVMKTFHHKFPKTEMTSSSCLFAQPTIKSHQIFILHE